MVTRFIQHQPGEALLEHSLVQLVSLKLYHIFQRKPNIFVKDNVSSTKEIGTNSIFLWFNEMDKDDLNECPRGIQV